MLSIKKLYLLNDFDKKIRNVMGGFCSGKRCQANSKTTTESQRWIDIRWLKKQGGFRNGFYGSFEWLRNGISVGRIIFITETDHITLYYHNSFDDELEEIEQEVLFDRTPCNFGGHRKWFLCSNCSRRVAVLYGAGKYFFCRHCYDLTYSSQQEIKMYRLMRKSQKIRERLGASKDLFKPILLKPKNMHQKTFDRLRMEANIAKCHCFHIMKRLLPGR